MAVPIVVRAADVIDMVSRVSLLLQTDIDDPLKRAVVLPPNFVLVWIALMPSNMLLISVVIEAF